MHPFRAAVEVHDIDAAIDLFTDDVVFNSPVVHKPYQGGPAVATILRAVIEVFEDFRYVREIDDAPNHALVFETRVSDRSVQGVDFLHHAPDDRIDELTVMVRPL